MVSTQFSVSKRLAKDSAWGVIPCGWCLTSELLTQLCLCALKHQGKTIMKGIYSLLKELGDK